MSNYDEIDFITDVGKVKEGVDSATDILDTSVENINSFSEINKWNAIYNDPNATLEQKQYAGVEIMNAFFSLGENNIPDELGSALFGTNISDIGANIIGKELFEIAIFDAQASAEKAGDVERVQICQAMINNIDASYEAYKIALTEKYSQNFPSSSKEWDMFYESYQENKDVFKSELTLKDWCQYACEFLEWHFSGGLGEALFDMWNKKDEDVTTAEITPIEVYGKYIENTNAISSKDIIKKLVASTKNSATKASNTVYDPIILDLDGDGFNVETKENGTNFDLDKNGFAEKINWTTKDGFLCLDLNGNGSIDNGGELFGDQTM